MLRVVMVLGLSALCLLGQNAALSGLIRDPAGAAISGASLQLSNTKNGARLETTTNESGLYVFASVAPGTYDLSVNKAGFATAQVNELVVEVSQTKTLNLGLKISQAQEAVTVTDEAALLTVDRADRSAVLENKFVLSIPLNVRNPLQLINYTPGVVQGGSGFGSSGTNTSSNTLTNTFRINGGRAGTTEVLLDGAANTTAFSNQTAGLPQVDAVQEFRVLTSPYAPEYGRTSGGVVSFGLRSGTNQFHGTLHEFLRNSVLDANGFNANRAGRPRQQLQRNQFGGTFNGPIWVPKVYNGRNRTFFFFGYEGLREKQAGSFTGTVPTDLEKQGNFSQTRDVNGVLIQMFDPVTTRLDPERPAGTTRYLRDAFAGNIVPASRLTTVGKNLLGYYPAANQPGRGASSVDNFFSNVPSSSNQDRIDIKIDHQLSSKHIIMGRYNKFKNENITPSYYSNPASPSTSNNLPGLSVQGRHTWLISNRDIFEHSFVYGYTESVRTTPGAGFDPIPLGFAPSTTQGFKINAFPAITATRLAAAGIPQIAVSSNRPEVYQYRATMTMIRANHSLKFGVDYRTLAGNIILQPPLSISATSNFTGGPNPAAALAASGSGIADLLLGAASVTASIVPFEQVRRPYVGVFVQDEWRISPKVTVTYGLRYNYEQAFHEKNSQYAYLDTGSASPIASRVPSLPNLRGGLVYPSGRSQATDRNNFDPRLGVAYRWNEKTVFRAGTGIFTHPAATGHDTSRGFSQSSTSVFAAADNVTPLFNLANPFPSGPLQPTGSSLGLSTALGQSVSAPLGKQQVSYSGHWSVDVQRQLPFGFLVDIGYAGNAGNRLYTNTNTVNLNQLPESAQSLGSSLLDVVPNPFSGVITDPTSILSRPTVQRGQLLRPYPQFQNLFANALATGHSTYHALQLKVEKRFSSGLAILLAYTHSKTIDNVGESVSAGGDATGFMNNNCFVCDRSLSLQHVPDVVRASVRYDIPFGYGRKFMNKGLLGRVAGGWAVGSFWSWDNGFPVRVLAPNDSNSFGGGVNMRPNATGLPASQTPTVVFQDNAPYFNRDAFSRPAPFTFGNVIRTLPDVRNPGTNVCDILIEKRFTITERISFDFRAEMFNAFNKVNWAGPGNNLISADFGRIFLRQVNAPRQIQFGARLSF